MSTPESPLLKYATVTIGETTLKLVYDFKSIALAERKVPGINLLSCFKRLDTLNANEAICLLWAAATKFQPLITFDDIAHLMSIDAQDYMLNCLAEAYVLSLPVKKDDAVLVTGELESPLATSTETA